MPRHHPNGASRDSDPPTEDGAEVPSRRLGRAPDEALERALGWAAEQGFAATSTEPLAGDVSARRYVRLTAGAERLVLALYPPEIASTCERFTATSHILTQAGVRVPRLVAVDCEHGRMLLEDVGRATLFDERDRGWMELEPYLELAVEVVARLAALPATSVAGLNPPLDETLLARELEHTWRIALGDADLVRGGFPAALATAFGRMVSELARSPRVVAHRDFMARNLVPLPADSGSPRRIVVLDHQDLRLAPAAYDLASLLNDSLYPPTDLADRLRSRLADSVRTIDYHRAAAQRGLKIVGTFLGFAERGDRRHLPLVDPSLEAARGHLAVLP
ncbi:MAG: phosphotransferase, partial [Thermoanaerobaculia bacterium]|nr:phosphotransferase [Thermoanaerobaculia bacterium]